MKTFITTTLILLVSSIAFAQKPCDCQTNLSPKDLKKHLQAETLVDSHLKLFALVRNSKDPQAIKIKLSGDRWVDLPLSMIYQTRKIADGSPEGEQQALMEISLKEPKSAESKLFYDILQSNQNNMEALIQQSEDQAIDILVRFALRKWDTPGLAFDPVEIDFACRSQCAEDIKNGASPVDCVSRCKMTRLAGLFFSLGI